VLRRILIRAGVPLLLMLMGACISFIAVAAIYVAYRPSLQIWHKTLLDGEFTAGSAVTDFTGYLALEDDLFRQLDEKIIQRIPPDERTAFNRFSAGSKSDPARWPTNWNRSFEWPRADARFGVLLLHGYSDSPYSLRALGERFRAEGAHVLGLRIPGHGTAPSALRLTTAEDMNAAVSLAMAHLQQQLPGKPIIIVGYSNGAALALYHTFAAINDGKPDRPAGLVLMSPEISISRVAALATWQAWIGEVLGISELAWDSIEVEFDPFKYNSFAVNAGAQAYRMTELVQDQIARLTASGRLGDVPPILAFQSEADATVTATAVKRELFDRLDSKDAELVLFDVNRVFETEGLVDQPAGFDTALEGPAHKYTVSIVTNRNPGELAAVVRQRLPMSDAVTTQDIGASWPRDVYSLAHIALPFPPDDPLYGDGTATSVSGLNLGRAILRGEKGRLQIPDSAMTRQHWNPFYRYMESRILGFVGSLVPKD
jgi:alpha-beta hydrolase superfamily lysophospholipase